MFFYTEYLLVLSMFYYQVLSRLHPPCPINMFMFQAITMNCRVPATDLLAIQQSACSVWVQRWGFAWGFFPFGVYFYTFRLEQNDSHFGGDIFKHIFFTEKFWISKNISERHVVMGLVDNILALVQIIASCYWQQAITWTYDLWCQIALTVRNELNYWVDIQQITQDLHMVLLCLLYWGWTISY